MAEGKDGASGHEPFKFAMPSGPCREISVGQQEQRVHSWGVGSMCHWHTEGTRSHRRSGFSQGEYVKCEKKAELRAHPQRTASM